MAVKGKNRDLFGGGGRGSAKGKTEDSQPSDAEIAKEVDQLEKDINELKATYELYFMGVEKVEPVPQRDLIKSTLRRWQERKPRNTRLKFRIQQLKARVVSLENYWQRTLRQREDGTYHRDITKARRREAEHMAQQKRVEQLRAQDRGATTAPPGSPRPDGQSIASGELAAAGHSSAVTHGASQDGRLAPGRGRSMARPSASSVEDLTDAKLRRLYKTYVGARKRCGEKADLRYEDMAAALRKQVPRLIDKTGARTVEFKVVIRSGKAVLKALPKNE